MNEYKYLNDKFSPILTVSQLGEKVKQLLELEFYRIWVEGEVSRLKIAPNKGHIYFELIEKGEGDEILAKIDAVIWKSNWTNIKRKLGEYSSNFKEGMSVRVQGTLDFYPPHGRIKLSVVEMDTTFIAGVLELRRKKIRENLIKSGLYNLNKQLSLPLLPMRVVVITSRESAAYFDFVSSIKQSQFGFKLYIIHSLVQGKEAEKSIVKALESAKNIEADCIAIIRGGGSKSDLAVFDSEKVAIAIATSHLPVITGLGHEIDLSIADEVAHTRCKTPTMVAEFLVNRVKDTANRVSEISTRIERRAKEIIKIKDAELKVMMEKAKLASRVIDVGAKEISFLSTNIANKSKIALINTKTTLLKRVTDITKHSNQYLNSKKKQVSILKEKIVIRSKNKVEQIFTNLKTFENQINTLSPQTTLKRGFSITRRNGIVIKSVKGLSKGETIITQLKDGEITSVIGEADG